MTQTIEIVFYFKIDCHLCEQMEHDLMHFIQGLPNPAGINVVRKDIESNPIWYRQFREYVPTLVVNDEEICHYFFDAQELTEILCDH